MDSCDVSDVEFGHKVGQIDPEWDKSVTFSDKISVHFALKSEQVPN